VRRGATDVLAPVRSAGESVFRPLGDAAAGITGYDELEAENDELRRRVEALEGAALRGADAEAELEALLAARGLERFTALPTVSARVVGAPVSNVEQTVQLDRGRDHGIAVDMPVATGAGLVGRVVEVSGSRAVVRLVTDPASAVGVRLSATGDLGVAEGQGRGRPLRLGLVEPDEPVAAGELVVTSGTAASFFPPGIPVGSVAAASQHRGSLEQEATLAPAADLGRLRFVEVIRTDPG
jgi:rod shape-determining protein MreC